MLITLGLVLAATAALRVPTGICFDDPGELQLAWSVGGVMHPPGYAGHVILGRVAMLVPLGEPADRAALVATGFGIAALLVSAALLARIGTPMLIASPMVLLLTWLPSVWKNLVLPEVYAPSWAMFAASVYFAARYGHTWRKRDAAASGLLLGLLVGSRTSAALFVPAIGLAIALAGAGQALAPRVRQGMAALASVIAGVALCVGYLWIADRPDAPYNYLAQYNAETRTLPEATDGIMAKARRVAWLWTGRQHAGHLRISGKLARAQARRMSEQLLDGQLIRLVPLGLLAAAGSIEFWRRQRAVALAAWGALAGGIGFNLVYAADQTSDMLPIVFGGTILCGGAVPIAMRKPPAGRYRWAAGMVATGIAVASMAGIPARPDPTKRADAVSWLGVLEMGTLPANSTILTAWPTAPPLWYERLIGARRFDIKVINADPRRWPALAAPNLNDPVYYTAPSDVPPGWTLVPERNLWRLASSRL